MSNDEFALDLPPRLTRLTGPWYERVMQGSFAISLIRLGLISGLMLVFAGGCRNPERLDRREERDPLVMRGDARQRAGDLDGAIKNYMRALERRPQMALPHVKLGLIYKDRREHLLAIYHLTRYMEMRPTAAKNDMLRQLVIRAQNQFVASLPNPPEGALEEIALLERENQSLRVEVADLRQQVRTLREAVQQQSAAPPVARPAPAVDARAPSSRPSAPPEAQELRTYIVRRGDTLSRIASQVYGDSTQWRRIFEANRGILQSPESLREGQELVIP